LGHNRGFNWRRNLENCLIWFNLAKIERILKFNDGFEINSQVRNQ